MDRERQLAECLSAVVYAAVAQLAGMGKGKEPSPRLAEAIEQAVEILGFDPTHANDRHAERDAEIERLRAKLQAGGKI